MGNVRPPPLPASPFTPFHPPPRRHNHNNIQTQSQILFLIGLPLIIGPQKTFLFFARRQKLKGTLAFSAGIILILLRWALIGFLVELYGIMVLFGDFIGTLAGFVGGIPIVGPVIKRALEAVAGAVGVVTGGAAGGGGGGNANLPV